MKLTKAQRDFFKDIDLPAALAAGEGKVHFAFPHKGCIVEVSVFYECSADITVQRKPGDGWASYTDTDLTLLNIPDTSNVSGPAVLRMVHAAANKPEYSPLKQAWLATPYVEQWYVSVNGSCTEFSNRDEEGQYTIEVSEDPDDSIVTVAELFLSGELIHAFTIQRPYPNRQTVRSLLKLAEAITEAWRDAVLFDYDEGESK